MQKNEDNDQHTIKYEKNIKMSKIPHIEKLTQRIPRFIIPATCKIENPSRSNEKSRYQLRGNDCWILSYLFIFSFSSLDTCKIQSRENCSKKEILEKRLQPNV